MPHDRFRDLLSEMAAIAKAVNAFSSEAVQQEAFKCLVTALGVTEAPRGACEEGAESGGKDAHEKPVPRHGKKPARRRESGTPDPVDKGFDAQRLANQLKDRQDFALVSDRILHKRDLEGKLRLVLLAADEMLSSGDIHNALSCFDIKTSLSSVSRKLREMAPKLISSQKRERGAHPKQKLSGPARKEAEKWLDGVLKGV